VDNSEGYFFYVVREVVDCDLGTVAGDNYVVRSINTLTVGNYVNTDITPGAPYCAWKIIDPTAGPLYSGTVTTECLSLAGCCC